MWQRNILILGALVVCVAALGGCARAARDTTGFAIDNRITVDASFEDAWQTVKAVLREQDLDIYTRDKRGTFVAFSDMRRKYLILTPTRTKYTIQLDALSQEETTIHIEAVRQVYGVTLLTYPDWHDRKLTNAEGSQALLDAIQAKLGGEVMPGKTEEAG